MPGEKELIPPMVDILLEHRHIDYSIPFLASYVSKSGWNDIMTGFARHTRFKGKSAQEIFRFLRFQGQRPVEFRRYIFLYYLERYLAVLATMVIVLSLIPLSLLLGMRAVYVTAVGYSSILLIYCGFKFLHHRRTVAQKKQP
jgi:hypothetical protein